MRRPTVHDLAREARVSLATVDRVLNKRPGVRAVTIARVESAIARLGYVRDISAANLAKQHTYDLVFIIPDGRNSFMRGLEEKLEELKARMAFERVAIRILRVPAFDPDRLADTLNGIDLKAVSGVAVVATETPAVRAALARLADAGIPVVTLVSDVPDSRRSHYVGIDNVAAGRSAASLIGRFTAARPGKVALVAGSMLVRDHVERREGFDQVIRAEYPHLQLLPLLEGHDDAARTQAVLAACLTSHADIAAVYSIGAGNRGVIEALHATGRAGKVSVVGHELTDHTREALRSGVFDAIINQDAEQEVRSAIALLKAEIDRTPMADGRIRIEIYMRDNLP